MNQATPKTKSKTVNTQSVRFPMDLYCEIAEMAKAEDTTLNAIILRLVTLGLGYQRDFERAVRNFVFRQITDNEMKELLNGQPPTVHS